MLIALLDVEHMNLSLGDVVNFVLRNKGGKCFLNQNPLQVAYLIREAYEHGLLLVSINDTGNISGMIIAHFDEPKQELFITENLAMNIENLRAFAKIAKERWPKAKLRWMKNGIYKNPNTDKIYEKLLRK